MNPDSSRRGDAVLAEMERIVEEHAANFRRLLAADLAQLPLDEQAVDLAVDAFDAEKHRLWDPSYGDGASSCDAEASGVAAAIKAYLTAAGRS